MSLIIWIGAAVWRLDTNKCGQRRVYIYFNISIVSLSLLYSVFFFFLMFCFFVCWFVILGVETRGQIVYSYVLFIRINWDDRHDNGNNKNSTTSKKKKTEIPQLKSKQTKQYAQWSRKFPWIFFRFCFWKYRQGKLDTNL